MRILYTRQDGGLSVVNAAPNDGRFKTVDEWKAHVWSRGVPKDAINAVEIPNDYVLPSREFRDAWKQSGDQVVHDLEIARAIQLDRIRKAREPRLLDLDKEFMLALEKGVSTVEIIAKKQVLRDITEPLKNMELHTIEDVKNTFPAILNKETLDV